MAIIYQNYGDIEGDRGLSGEVDFLYEYNSFIANGNTLKATTIPTQKKAKALALLMQDNRYNGQCYMCVVIDGFNDNKPIYDKGEFLQNLVFTFNNDSITCDGTVTNNSFMISVAVIY